MRGTRAESRNARFGANLAAEKFAKGDRPRDDPVKFHLALLVANRQHPNVLQVTCRFPKEDSFPLI